MKWPRSTLTSPCASLTMWPHYGMPHSPPMTTTEHEYHACTCHRVLSSLPPWALPAHRHVLVTGLPTIIVARPMHHDCAFCQSLLAGPLGHHRPSIIALPPPPVPIAGGTPSGLTCVDLAPSSAHGLRRCGTVRRRSMVQRRWRRLQREGERLRGWRVDEWASYVGKRERGK